ncbi:MAG: hypothetical protein ACLFPX_01830 [Candidatus Omnitrophota bacterium]
MSYRCPICGEELGDDLQVFVDHMEEKIVVEIKRDHPEWVQKDGMCPKCRDYYKKQLSGI